MERPFHACCIAAPRSGEGKTTFAMGLMRLLTLRGLSVQGFKCGPDYIDPTFHTQATGRTSCNLDTWMMGAEGVRELWATRSEGADAAICEGVMGLFDGKAGVAAHDLSGSTVDCARVLQLPILLVVNVRGMAASIAALVEGFTSAAARQGVTITGIIANNVGSPRHADMLRIALERACLPPLLGALPRRPAWSLPERQLGLIPSDELAYDTAWLGALAKDIAPNIDIERLLTCIQRPRPKLPTGDTSGQTVCNPSKAHGIAVDESSYAANVGSSCSVCSTAPCDALASTAASTSDTNTQTPHKRMAVAQDAAFCFYYDANLRALRHSGWELCFFSPLADSALPSNIKALYLGGGYPEEFAEQIAANNAMRQSIQNFAKQGGSVYAECGGYMTLAKELIDANGVHYPMYGLINGTARMGARLRSLGYREIELCAATPFADAHTTLRGHEFHWSDMELHEDYAPLYLMNGKPCGVSLGSIKAGYGHLYWAHRPATAVQDTPQSTSQTRSEASSCASSAHNIDTTEADSVNAAVPSASSKGIEPTSTAATASASTSVLDTSTTATAPTSYGCVVLFNGASSAGKSTLSRRVRELLHDAGHSSLLLSMDDMLRATSAGCENAFHAEALDYAVIPALHAAAAAAAQAGNTVLLDHVIGENKDWLCDLQQRLGATPLYCVHVRCELEELEHRERARSDRLPDLPHARRQHATIYTFVPEDCHVDTTYTAPALCAERVTHWILQLASL